MGCESHVLLSCPTYAEMLTRKRVCLERISDSGTFAPCFCYYFPLGSRNSTNWTNSHFPNHGSLYRFEKKHQNSEPWHPQWPNGSVTSSPWTNIGNTNRNTRPTERPSPIAIIEWHPPKTPLYLCLHYQPFERCPSSALSKTSWQKFPESNPNWTSPRNFQKAPWSRKCCTTICEAAKRALNRNSLLC